MYHLKIRAGTINKEVFETSYTDKNGGLVTVRYTGDESFMRDMGIICQMFILRGAAVQKIEQKSTDMMKFIVSLMKVKYTIDTNKRAPGRQIPSDVITISRIAACFPSVTVTLFVRDLGRHLVDPEIIFHGVILPPKALFSPMVASTFPVTTTKPLAPLLLIAIHTDNLLHRVAERTGLRNLFTFLKASYNSNAMTEKSKTSCCKK